MGDMANEALDRMMDTDEWQRHHDPVFVRLITCHCCGQTGLQWMRYQGKWRLGNNVFIHDCPVNPLVKNTP